MLKKVNKYTFGFWTKQAEDTEHIKTKNSFFKEIGRKCRLI